MRLAIFLMLASSTVWADAELARQHFQKGTTFYDLGQYREAAREYEEAYKEKSDPALLFNIGQAYRAAGETAAALRAYKAFLRRNPDAKNRAEVEAQMTKLQRILDDQAVPVPPPAAPPPQHETAAPPAPAPVATPAPVSVTAAPARTPVYKKWWLWTAVGGVVVAGLVVGLAVAYTTPNDAPGPGAIGLKF